MTRVCPPFILSLVVFLAWTAISFEPRNAIAMTGKEIIEKAIQQNLHDTARLLVKVATFKGRKQVADHVLWFAHKTSGAESAIFIDFEEPKQAKGMRFLFLVNGDNDPKAWMYLPATRKTVPLSVADDSATIAGTGLTLQDFQAVTPERNQEEKIEREEDLDGKRCWLIRVSSPKEKDERLVWISKDQFLVLKSQQLGSDGKVKRSFKVVEFFKDGSGKELPREEEITIPAKDTRIRVRQEHALFGIQIPPEITAPDTFGVHRWKD